MMRADARGQAAVEFALGSLVFVTVLLFGIHFAEVGYLSAKVHEAAAAAMWDATAYRADSIGARVQAYPSVFYDASQIAAQSPTFAGGAAGRYQDWDGRTDQTPRSTGAPLMVLTQAKPMAVSCVTDIGKTRFPLTPYAPFLDSAGVSCGAQGDFGFGFMRMPNKFAEGASGFFKAPHNSKIGSLTTLCASGRATGGTCNGTLSVLLGDDALAGAKSAGSTTGDQEGECGLTVNSPNPCTTLASGGNFRFYQAAIDNWNRSMQLSTGGAWSGGYTRRPENWADAIVGGVPSGQITGFYLSFRGEESNFVESVPGGGLWQSNPMDAPNLSGVTGGLRNYRRAYSTRQNCANGLKGVAGETGGGAFCYLGKFPMGDN